MSRNHSPPVSDATIFAVNVDGTFNLLEACRAHGVRALVFASSMAYGWRSVYSVTKVLGDNQSVAETNYGKSLGKNHRFMIIRPE